MISLRLGTSICDMNLLYKNNLYFFSIYIAYTMCFNFDNYKYLYNKIIKFILFIKTKIKNYFFI